MNDPERSEKSRAPRPEEAGRRWIVLGLATFAVLLGLIVWRSSQKQVVVPTAMRDSSERIVSLSPGITETIEALGKTELLVGISDYCQLKSADGRALPPRVGTAITPHYERIATSAPTHIITTQVAGEQLSPLSRLAETTTLPWLTLDEWTASIHELGKIVGAQEKAQELGLKIQTTLNHPPKADGPRVLLALNYGDSGSNDIWFIRRNSIHGAVLHAAGAKNAVARDITGQPKLSPEQLLKEDPDGIIVLLSAQSGGDSEKSLEHFRKWQPLKAAQNNHLYAIPAPEALTVGPGLLNLIPTLRDLVAKIKADLPQSGEAGP